MKPFWISFYESPIGWGLGAGVTAIDEADARRLIATIPRTDLRIERICELNTVEELDQDHVVPNMGKMLKRGVWYPKGYEAVV